MPSLAASVPRASTARCLLDQSELRQLTSTCSFHTWAREKMVSFVSLEAFVLCNELCRGRGCQRNPATAGRAMGGGAGTLQARPLALPKSIFLTGKDPRKHKVRVTGQLCTAAPTAPRRHQRPSSPQKPSAGGRGPTSLPTGSITKWHEGEEFRVGVAVTVHHLPSARGPARGLPCTPQHACGRALLKSPLHQHPCP